MATKTNANFPFRYQVVLTALLAGLLLVVANSAIWVNRSIFDTTTFTNTAVTSITSDSSRQALASEIVDRALADRPIVKNVAGNTATKLIAGLLGSNQFNEVLTKAVGKIQVYVTSKEQKSVALDLSGVKGTVNNLLTLADNRGVADTNNATTRLNNIPDELVLVNADNIPSFYKAGVALLWLAPLSVLLALGLLAYPYVRRPGRYQRIALVQGAALVFAGVLSLMVGPLFRPPALARVLSPNMRIVVGNLYDAFIASFNQQAYYLVTIGLAVALLPTIVFYGLKWYNKRSPKAPKNR
ncbi:MAG: hypothetical protein ABIQ89_00065 [Candidatus Saccharimonadales bacterium]